MFLGNYFHKPTERPVHFTFNEFYTEDLRLEDLAIWQVNFYTGSAWCVSVYVAQEAGDWHEDLIEQAAAYLADNEMFGVVVPFGSEQPCECTLGNACNNDCDCFCEWCNDQTIHTDSGHVVVSHVNRVPLSFLDEIEPLEDHT